MRNNRAHQGQPESVRVVLPRTIEQRLKRMEDLLIEMRHEQDVLLKRLAKTQVQLDALLEKSQRGASRELFRSETPHPPPSTAS